MRDTTIHPYNKDRDPSTSHPDDEVIASIDLSSNSIAITSNELDHADIRLKIGFAGDKPTNLSGVKWGYDLQQVLDNARTKFAYVNSQEFGGYSSSTEEYITIANFSIKFRTLYKITVWCYNQDVRFQKDFEFKSYDYQDYTPEGYPDASLPVGHEREGRTTVPHNFWD